MTDISGTRDKKGTPPEHGGKRAHIGARIAKILLPLIAGALCLADAIECVLWRATPWSCLLLFCAAVSFCIAAWLFLGYELGLYYDRQEKKLSLSKGDNAQLQRKKSRGGWICMLVGAILFVLASFVGNMVPLLMFYALLMT